MKKENVTQILASGSVVAEVSLETEHDKYFALVIRFPNGSWRKLFVSYDSQIPKQNWHSDLVKSLKTKA